ncbi:4a-hydroxytetrahydrobiopterin dehydratase [Ammoniphilus resinae]|uniref:Putative pterin-4-alpha-carbinolamine dehydratase n=1 Tax=Ammoniphilus resinae TaxID=861532 RepID=A0ABS4GRG7_9BACL|nr:4a-hydroxytetrahydrobiopterin dehydratase [Ammoniphilus resinae]MBP1932854.1 4a-hydroxytetrahydrobiopterin dehydratase [Ammoniphilus resinae]
MARLSKEQIEYNISKLPGWKLNGNCIDRTIELNSFKEAISFVNQVAEFAEEMDHHPEIKIDFRKVKLSLTTHTSGGLTGKDFALAQRINKLVPYSGKAM